MTRPARPGDGEQKGSNGNDVADLYARYRKELRRYFTRRGHRQDADDLLHVMFMDLLQRPPPPEVRNVQAYLFGAAYTTLHDLNRSVCREPPTVRVDDMPSGDAGGRRLGLWQENDSSSLLEQEQIDRALADLPPECRLAAIRQYRDGWTYVQIAQELGVTAHTVKKYISKALRFFAEYFTGEPESEA